MLYAQMLLQHMINRSLKAEMQTHAPGERSTGNVRNGKSRKPTHLPERRCGP